MKLSAGAKKGIEVHVRASAETAMKDDRDYYSH
jgi:hypothetical protein